MAMMPAIAGPLPGGLPGPPGGSPLGSPLGAYRSFRATIQALDDELAEVQSGKTALRERCDKIKWLVAQASQDVRQLGATALGDDNTDVLRDLQIAFHDIDTDPITQDPGRAYSSDELLRHLGRLRDCTKKLVFLVARITIPPRINDWLGGMRPGDRIKFDEFFADEVPHEDSRAELLKTFAATPRLFPRGLIDTSTGIIYRYSADLSWQLTSAIVLLLLLALAPVTIVVLCRLEVAPLGPAHMRPMLMGWAMLLVGVAAHWILDRLKLARAAASQGKAPPGLQFTDLLPRLNAAFGDMFLRVLSIGVAYVAFVYLNGLAGAGEVGTALLAGYSADSLVALATTRLETAKLGKLGGAQSAG